MVSGLLFQVPDTAEGEVEVAQVEGDTEVPWSRTEDLVDSDSAFNNAMGTDYASARD